MWKRDPRNGRRPVGPTLARLFPIDLGHGRRPVIDWTLKEWGIMLAVLPPLAVWSFLAVGGWLILPEPWSTIAAVVVYGLAFLVWLSWKIQDRRQPP